MDRTADLLFQYLKNILYYPEKAELDINELPEDFKKLGSGMKLLAEWVNESRDFSMSMAKGELSKEPPAVDNVLAAPMKELQGNLRHLTWQTQQVAKGDFSQKVDFMGEFSIAFNEMTKQLAERTESLIAEKQLVDSMNKELKKNLDLMLALTNYTHNMIYVIADNNTVFKNRSAKWFTKIKYASAELIEGKLIEKSFEEESLNWDINLAENEKTYYRVESYKIEWSNTPAIVHIVTDNTEQKKHENLIYNMAYIDSLTGLHNRRYAVDMMDNLRSQNKPFILTVVDVDYLKYCNDKYGHDKGDEYLKTVATLLQAIHGGDICRIGGDEFYCIEEETDMDMHIRELEELREMFIEQSDLEYPHSFSYASVLIDGDKGLDEYLHEVDKKMYEYKKLHRSSLSDFIDERLS
ncbi:MAG: diguanylate cyclase [Erysipelotrichaceae bacterium]|nr:diguanylate cyclase [Erysipelotrichaceae bacterium]